MDLTGRRILIAGACSGIGRATSVLLSTKGALDGMARSLAVELATKRIRVDCVAPEFVRTPMFERVAKLWDSRQNDRVEALHPLGIGNSEDIANAAAFLLADTARWIRGIVLVTDGGYTVQ